MNEITIDGVVYVPKESAEAKKLNELEYCIIRTHSAGVFAGYIVKRTDKEVEIRNARRIWYWDGANTLSDLANYGTKAPQNCKFPAEVEKIIVTEAVEILNCTEKARLSIKDVPVWVVGRDE